MKLEVEWLESVNVSGFCLKNCKRLIEYQNCCQFILFSLPNFYDYSLKSVKENRFYGISCKEKQQIVIFERLEPNNLW